MCHYLIRKTRPKLFFRSTMNDSALSALSLVLLAAALVLFWPEKGLVPRWKTGRRIRRRAAFEDALKHIHDFETAGREPSLQSVAGALQVTPDRAAEILDRLQRRRLVHTEGDAFRLTPDGRGYALQVIRAHRLWERYLADETGFDEMSWHELAEAQEHRLSPEEANALSAQLGHPTFDPHGDPIPTSAGSVGPSSGVPLTDLQPETRAAIAHIEDEPGSVYAALVAAGLHAGMEIRVVDVSPDRIVLGSRAGEHALTPLQARNLTVIPLPKGAPETPAGVPLSSIRTGESARVLRISQRMRGIERRRMLDLGVIPGTVIQAVMRAPGGDPAAYRIRGAVIALRDEQAGLILCTPEP